MKLLHHHLYAAGFVLFLFPGIFFVLATTFGFLGVAGGGGSNNLHQGAKNDKFAGEAL